MAAQPSDHVFGAASAYSATLADARNEGYNEGYKEARERMLKWYGKRVAQVAVLATVFGAGIGVVAAQILAHAT